MEEIPNIRVCDMHTGGEPLRIVVGSYPEIHGKTILDKIRYHRDHLDHLRKFLILEPRGHNDMYGAVFVNKDLEDADFAAIFLHNQGYSTMCGHAVMALARYAVDHGMVAKSPDSLIHVNIQVPCGLVRCTVDTDGTVTFRSVPAFSFAEDLEINMPNLGPVLYDISYGGAFYAIVQAQRLGLKMDDSLSKIKEKCGVLKELIGKEIRLEHPDHNDLAFLYGVILIDGRNVSTTSNICLFANNQIDRSPTGSGVTARMASDYSKGVIRLNQSRTFGNPITHCEFIGTVVEETQCGDRRAVVVEVSGKSCYSGTSEFRLEKNDLIGRGFMLQL